MTSGLDGEIRGFRLLRVVSSGDVDGSEVPESRDEEDAGKKNALTSLLFDL